MSALAPIVILVAPQLGENIGMAARAMANCHLRELRLVAPQQGWPDAKAERAAVGAFALMDEVRVFPDLPAATGDLHYLLAMTARDRRMVKPIFDAQAAAAETCRRISTGERVGFVFGAERMGLLSDDVALADAIVTIPLNPEFSSLNLAQAVLLLGYEWLRASAIGSDLPASPDPSALPADKTMLYDFFAHFERALDDCGFLRNLEARPNMVRNLRNMWTRARLTEQEIRTLHGVVKELTTLRQKREKP